MCLSCPLPALPSAELHLSGRTVDVNGGHTIGVEEQVEVWCRGCVSLQCAFINVHKYTSFQSYSFFHYPFEQVL